MKLGITKTPLFFAFECFQCESNELKLLIQRLNALEKYVKDKQNQTGAQPQPCVQPTQQVTPGAAKICPTTPAPLTPTTPTQGPNTAPTKPNTSPPQPPKVAGPSPPVSPPAPAPAQVQAPGSPPPAPSPVAVKPQTPPSVVLPSSPAQVLWASPAASPVPMAVPVGFTVQSTVEAPGTFPGGNGQVEIQVRGTPCVGTYTHKIAACIEQLRPHSTSCGAFCTPLNIRNRSGITWCHNKQFERR